MENPAEPWPGTRLAS